jgi:hypothetical protein
MELKLGRCTGPCVTPVRTEHGLAPLDRRRRFKMEAAGYLSEGNM